MHEKHNKSKGSQCLNNNQDYNNNKLNLYRTFKGSQGHFTDKQSAKRSYTQTHSSRKDTLLKVGGQNKTKTLHHNTVAHDKYRGSPLWDSMAGVNKCNFHNGIHDFHFTLCWQQIQLQ